MGRSAVSGVHLSAWVLDLHKHSHIPSFSLQSLALTDTRMNTKRQRSSDSTLAEMPIITVHLLSIPTQSEVTQKALSELTSCPLESPSSFFCWLQLSVVVWARCRLITRLPQMSPSSTFMLGGVTYPEGVTAECCVVHIQRLNVKCSALYGWMSCTTC